MARPIRVGIIGTGWGVNVQVPSFRAAGLEVSALCGRQPEKTAKFGKELSIPFTTTDYRELLRHPEVDIVSIVTPPHLHSEMAKAALEAGKHVLLDKPFCLNSSESQELVKISHQQHDKCLSFVDHELRFLPLFQNTKKIVQSGRLGKIFFVEATFTSPLAVAVDHNDWWYDKSKGGGLLGALGSHLIDFLTFFLSDRVAAVSSQLDTFGSQFGEDPSAYADNISHVNLKFAQSGIKGRIHLNGLSPINSKGVVILGEKGSLHLDINQCTLHSYDKEGKGAKIEHQEDLSVNLGEGIRVHAFNLGTFLLGKAVRSALLSNDWSLVTAVGASFDEAHHVQCVLDACRVSNQNHGAWVNI